MSAEMDAAIQARTEAYINYGALLDNQPRVRPGRSQEVVQKRRKREKRFGAVTPDTLRGLGEVEGYIYPRIVAVVLNLARNGISSRDELARTELYDISLFNGIGEKSMLIIRRLQELCLAEQKVNNLKAEEGTLPGSGS